MVARFNAVLTPFGVWQANFKDSSYEKQIEWSNVLPLCD